MVELNIPNIDKNGEIIGYGGNQEWFLDQWARRAGCASVLASNMYASYHDPKNYAYDDFLKIMETMFQNMTPGYMGYPNLYNFARTFVKLM